MEDDTETLRRFEENGSRTVIEDYARDTSYSRADLLPRFLDLETIQFLRDASETEKKKEHTQKLWDSLLGQGYADLKAIAESAKARRHELKHRWEAEAKAVNRGDMKAEHRRYPNEVRAYLYHLDLRAGAARQMMQYIEEEGRPKKWTEVSNEIELSTLTEYQATIKEVLEENEPGTFEDKAPLYRKVDNRMGHKSGNACLSYLNRHMEDEPDNEHEWRDHFNLEYNE